MFKIKTFAVFFCAVIVTWAATFEQLESRGDSFSTYVLRVCRSQAPCVYQCIATICTTTWSNAIEEPNLQDMFHYCCTTLHYYASFNTWTSACHLAEYWRLLAACEGRINNCPTAPESALPKLSTPCDERLRSPLTLMFNWLCLSLVGWFELTSFANWRPLIVTRKVVHQAIVTIYVEAILVVSPVVWLTARPRQVRQVSARYARYKRALRHRVRAVDKYKVIWHVCKARFMWSQEVRFSCGIELLHQQFFAVAPTIFFMPLRNHETQSRFKMA